MRNSTSRSSQVWRHNYTNSFREANKSAIQAVLFAFRVGKGRGEVGKANRSVVDENLFALRAKKCLREDGKCEQKRRRRRFVRIARQGNACGKVENANKRVTEEELFASRARKMPAGR